MKKFYTFSYGKFEFDDTKSVRELIQHAFDQFGYYEPAGIEIVTIFQCHVSKTNFGWFTTDTTRSCAKEIENPDELCFAYYMPDIFYFAEGGWGHHMKELGNHPEIPNPVSLKIRFEDFNNTVTINGNYSFNNIISYLQKTTYLSENCTKLRIHPIGIATVPIVIPFSDEIMKSKLTEFKSYIEKYSTSFYHDEGFIYGLVYEIC